LILLSGTEQSKSFSWLVTTQAIKKAKLRPTAGNENCLGVGFLRHSTLVHSISSGGKSSIRIGSEMSAGAVVVGFSLGIAA